MAIDLHKLARRERGTALVEAAIMIPVLIMLLFWAIGVTDIMLLRVKASEAARYALWETTVFRQQNEILPDVRQRFRDLKSPQGINLEYTGQMLYPQATNMTFTTNVQTNRPVSLGGKVKLDNPTGLIDKFLNLVLGAVTGTVDGATRFFRFNTNGAAAARVTVRASHIGSTIFAGGEILHTNMEHSAEMQNYTFAAPVGAANPMRLVFDTWKAWPKPRAFETSGGKTNTTVDPMQTYVTVEEQVSSQVDKVAFFGLKQLGFVTAIDNFLGKVRANPVAKFLFGGTIPSIIATDRMDSKTRGPITIRPVASPDANFVPGYNPGNGDDQGSHRLGELASYGNPVSADYPRTAMIDKQDVSRYTVPFKINSQYFKSSGNDGNGGNDHNINNILHTVLKPQLSTNNDYVRTYQCRGHFFAGSKNAGETEVSKRYKAPGINCYQ